MPIASAFAVTALIAVIFNSWFVIRSYRQRRKLKILKENGPVLNLANTFIRVWLTILISDLFVLLAGIGILTGHSYLGYLIAIVPVASTLVGIFALVGF